MKLTSSLTHDERDLCFEVAAMSVNRFLDLDYMEIDEVKLSLEDNELLAQFRLRRGLKP